jgi:hypothetical protein
VKSLQTWMDMKYNNSSSNDQISQNVYLILKGILSTKIVIFSYPKLLSLSVLTFLPKNHMLFTVSKQCACSIRVHIEGDMNRFEFLSSRTIILIALKWHRFCLIGKPNMFFPSFLNRFSYFMNL